MYTLYTLIIVLYKAKLILLVLHCKVCERICASSWYQTIYISRDENAFASYICILKVIIISILVSNKKDL